MADYKSGPRATSLPGLLPPTLMIGLSKAATDAEVEAAANYFSALQPRKRIKVIESDTAPKTHVAGLPRAPKSRVAGFAGATSGGGDREPLQDRIVEVPDDLLRFEARDPRSTFTVY